MLVYHTSDVCFERPDNKHSRDALDFGKGFYVTKLMEQAEKYSWRFLRAGKDAYIHVFEYPLSGTMNVKVFDSLNIKR